MQWIRLILEYDGTAYCGWQVQPNGSTVQAALEAAIQQLTGETLRVQAASRTDSGVHARGQVAVLATQSDIPPDRFALALNSRLPPDIAVRASDAVDRDFDPRRQARRKRYTYTIIRGPVRPALERHCAWHVKHRLDVERMQAAAQRLVGTHDFTSFANQECNVEDANNVRTLELSAFTAEGARLVYGVEGRSFLYNMVRNLVGTLVDVGAGRFAPDDIKTILAARDRAAAGQGAPAHGLCLEWVQYE